MKPLIFRLQLPLAVVTVAVAIATATGYHAKSDARRPYLGPKQTVSITFKKFYVSSDRNGPQGLILTPKFSGATMTSNLGYMTQGTPISASVAASAKAYGVRELHGCGSSRRVYRGGFVRLQIVAGNDQIVATTQTRDEQWRTLHVATTAQPQDMPYAVRVVAGGPPAQYVSYRSFIGAGCTPRTILIAPTGEFRLPSYQVDGPSSVDGSRVAIDG